MKKLSKICAISIIGLLFVSNLSSCASKDNGIQNNDKVDDKLNFGKLVGDYSLDVAQNFNNSVVAKTTKIEEQEVSIIVEMAGETQSDKFLNAKQSQYNSIKEYAESNNGISHNNYLVQAQAKLAKELLNSKYISEIKGNYTVLINGFAAKTTYKNVDKIRNYPGVESVLISREYALPQVQTNITANDTACDDETGIAVNDTEYQGEGMFVAVLDSGLDYTHPAFKGEAPSPKVSKNDIKNVLETNTMSCELIDKTGNITIDDVYISQKVPFAYDYADQDSDVLPAESDHGTHVSGIIVGDDETNNFAGVAPKAQLAFMKVFPDEEEKAPSDVIIRALEDSALLGVDAINESLGSVSGFSYEYGVSDENERLEERINAIYEKLTNLGISLLISAGNDYYQSFTAVDGSNRVENPESNTVGSPGSYATSFTVASVERKKTSYLLADNISLPITFTEAYDNKSNEKNFIEDLFAIWNRRNPNDQKDIEKDSIELDYVVVPGLGTDDDFKKVNVRDKLAIVERGVLTFEAKIGSALSAGATAVLIYNNTSGVIRMTCGESVRLPAASLTNKLGLLLKEKQTGKITVNKDLKAGPFMSDFSSLGPNPDLQLKPEITSCGGDVKSAVIGGGYEEFSGTSMSSPNACGIVLAVRQYIQNNWTKLTGKPTSEMTNVAVTKLSQQLVMSTAIQCNNEESIPYSPRKQGAGMASLSNVINTTTYLHVGDSDKVKLELGDDKKKTGEYELKFNVKNTGTTTTTYNLSTTTMTEGVTIGDQGINTISNDPFVLNPNVTIEASNGVSITGTKVSVPAGVDGEIKVKIKLTDQDKVQLAKFPNGMFVDGYVTLKSLDANGVDLSIPFLAFYGDWLEAPVWDLTYYDIQCPELYDEDIKEQDRIHAALNATTPYGHYGEFYMIPLGGYVYTIDSDKYEQILATEDKAAISLYEEAIYDFYTISGGLLRAPREMKVSFTDAISGEVYWEKTYYNVRKDTFYQGVGRVIGYSDDISFSALENSIPNNTKIIVTYDVTLDYEGGNNLTNGKQSFSFYVDYEAPTLENVEYYKELNPKTGKYNYYVDVDLSDNRYVMSYSPCIIQENKSPTASNKYRLASLEPNIPVYQEEAGATNHIRIDITKHMDAIINSASPDQFYLYVDDYAMNTSLYYIALNGCDFKDLTVTQNEIVISENEVININDYVNLDNAMLEGLTWTTNSKTVVSVNQAEVIGLKRGTATVIGSSSNFKTSITLKIKVLGSADDGYQKFDKPVPDDFLFSSYEVIYMFDDDAQDSKIGEIGSVNYNLSKTITLYPGEKIKINATIYPWYADTSSYSIEWKYGACIDIDEDTNILTATEAGTTAVYGYLCKDDKRTKLKDSFKVEVLDSYIYSGSFFENYKGAEEIVALSESMNLKYIANHAFSLYQYYLDSEGEIDIKPYGNDFVEQVILPNGIETIYQYAFAKLSKLKEINIPNTVKEIYHGTFLDDTALEIVTIPDDSVLVKVLYDAFRNCSSLTSINLSHVVTIGSNAFRNCTSLTSVDLTNLRYYGSHVFDGCTSLASVTLSKDTAIGDYMFANTKLQTLVLDQAYIGKNAFENCKSLTSVTFTNPNVVIDSSAFRNCTNLTSVTFAENSNVTIKDKAFENTGITSLTLPNATFSLGDSIFNKGKIANITLSSDTVIDEVFGAPFNGASKLATFALNGTSAHYVVKDDVLYSKDEKVLVFAPVTKVIASFDGLEEFAPGALGGNKTTAIVLPATFKKFGAYALKNSSVKSIDFNNATVEFGKYALANTTSLTTITNIVFNNLSNNIFDGSKITTITFAENAVIDSYALANMSSLTSVTIKSNTTIKDYAFYKSFAKAGGEVILTGATNVTIGDYAFAESKIKTIDLSNVTSIGKYAFYNATLLEAINLTSAESIGEYAFYNCSSATSIVLNNTLISLPNYVFYGVSKVTTIDLLNVETINEGALANMSALTTIDTSKVKIMGKECFRGDKNLSTVNMTSIVTLEDSVFVECSNLNNITFPISLDTIPTGTFYECDGLDTIDVSHVTKIGYKAFYGCGSLTNINLPLVEIIEDSAFQASALLQISLPKCKEVGVFAFYQAPLASISMPVMEHIETLAFASTKLEEINLPTSLKKIGPCAFAYNSNLVAFKNGDNTSVKNNVFVLDNGVLYIVNDDGKLTLDCYPLKKDSTTYRVLDNTTRIQEYAFINNETLTKVTFPTTLETIGDSAFYNCEKLATYEFLGKKAPTLEGYYNVNLINYINKNEVENLPIDMQDMYKNSYWSVYYFYNNFYDYLGLNDELELTIIYDNDAVGFDSYVYRHFFKNKQVNKVKLDEYTISFNTDGGSVVSSIKVVEGNVPNAPTSPTKNGYTFVKWVDESGNDFTFSSPITKNITLKAIWNENNTSTDNPPASSSSLPSSDSSSSQPDKPDNPRKGCRGSLIAISSLIGSLSLVGASLFFYMKKKEN